MTRLRGGAVPGREIIFGLISGLVSEYTDAEVEVGWKTYGKEIIANDRRDRSGPGRRPWGWWVFERQEAPPDFGKRGSKTEPIRLAEIGELRDDEIAAIAEKAAEAKLRIGTTAEYIPSIATGT